MSSVPVFESHSFIGKQSAIRERFLRMASVEAKRSVISGRFFAKSCLWEQSVTSVDTLCQSVSAECKTSKELI